MDVGIFGPRMRHVQDREGEALFDFRDLLEGEGTVVELSVRESFLEDGVDEFLNALRVELGKGPAGRLDR